VTTGGAGMGKTGIGNFPIVPQAEPGGALRGKADAPTGFLGGGDTDGALGFLNGGGGETEGARTLLSGGGGETDGTCRG
jgi:hypothetical protein